MVANALRKGHKMNNTKAADNGKICIVVTHDNELINKLYEREDNNAEDIHR